MRSILEAFSHAFFDDNRERTEILGINPGRYGAGGTGITFTDPLQLEGKCGIKNSFPGRSELSSKFIYEVIEALSPLGNALQVQETRRIRSKISGHPQILANARKTA